MSQWHKNRQKEMYLGSTLIGPHRDDLTIQISKREAKHFSSEGQKRCSVASLRLAEWEHFQKASSSPPLMGIDDVGIQLDEERQTLLHTEMKNLNQVFLTSPLPLTNANHVIRVVAGALRPLA
jgi:DNA replication and repair protein RecF